MQYGESFIDYLKAYKAIPPGTENRINISIIRSYSCENLEQILGVTAHRNDMPCVIRLGGFGLYAQEILDPTSFLYREAPDVLVVAVNFEDIFQDIFRKNYTDAAEADVAAATALDRVQNLLRRFRERSASPVFLCNFIYPYFAPDALFHSQATGLRTMLRKINAGLAALTAAIPNTFIVDLERAVYELGASRAYDRKMLRLARNPYATATYIGLAEQIVGLLAAIRGKRKKCIVVDCDNTLWKGIIGEDGMSGIAVDEDFQEMQRRLLYWKSTGILLAVCSKNNAPDVAEVFDKHPDMVLKLQDFAALRINWTDKAENIRQLAQELNIGLDSLIFIDDSEFECALVRDVLPMVQVVYLSGDSRTYPETVQHLAGLNFVSLTEEDTQRAAMYMEQKKREEFRAEATDMAAYLAGLEMCLEFSRVNATSLARAAQLTQKTNQFNLTTRRYTEDDLLRLEADGHLPIILRVADRFGDNGWTGLAVIDAREAPRWSIDTFLLSCRVMGRTVEQAFFAIIRQLALAGGVREIVGTYIPTAKNKPAATFYQDLGFVENGGTWHYDTARDYAAPSYFQISLFAEQFGKPE